MVFKIKNLRNSTSTAQSVRAMSLTVGSKAPTKCFFNRSKLVQ